MRSRVVVTGLGIVSPIGIGVSDFWKAALAGQSGISAITSFDPLPVEGYRSKVAGQVRSFAVERFLDSAHGERVDRWLVRLSNGEAVCHIVRGQEQVERFADYCRQVFGRPTAGFSHPGV